MSTPSSELSHFLDTLATAARAGDRVPTVRELMRRFGVSQALVQAALGTLKARGLIDSQVGRGTFFKSDATAGSDNAAPALPKVRTVLLLRRSISIARGRVVVDGLQRRFAADGHRVLEVSYTDPDHARTVLKGLPRFDACMVQSSFDTLTVETLAAVRQKADAVVIDGLALGGTDVDAVGLEWGEPLAAAVQLLVRQGHSRIAHATTSRRFLANELGLRRFDHLCDANPSLQLHAIRVSALPQDGFESALVGMLKARQDAAGQLPFTALVAWGIEDGAKFRTLLTDMGLAVPSQLSVVLLGRTDLANEHANFFDTVGGQAADQIECLHQAITERWADPQRAYGVRLLPVVTRAGASIGTPRDTPPQRRDSGGKGIMRG